MSIICIYCAAEIEPPQPFSLGLLIANDGYGIAQNLKITSSQPEIIENEKGLLITFEIIGSQLKNEAGTTSLTMEFGDLLPQTTTMARWLMITSLQGTFSNYSATFENINPLGKLTATNKLTYIYIYANT